MRACPGVPRVRGVWLGCLTWVVLISAMAVPGWAAPRFGRPGTFSVDGSPVGVRAAVIDAQVGRDLLTANEAGAEGPSLSFLYNRGLGSFFPEQRMGLSAADFILQAVAAGDFDADGRDDFAVAVDDISAFPVRAAVLVFLNNGNGFRQPVRYMLSGLLPQCLEAVDVTGDGALDLVVCHGRSVGGNVEGLVTVLAGQLNGTTANGTFQQIFSGPVGSSPSMIGSGDIDADGRTDLVVVDPTEQRVLALYGNATPARFGSATEVAELEQPVAALVHTLPGQPLPEVIVARSPRQLAVFRQTAARQFAAPVTSNLAFLPMAMALGEIDDDGIEDLVVVSGQGADLFYGQDNGSFDFGESIFGGDFEALTLADLNGDGRLDVAASASAQDRVMVALNGADVPATASPTPTITPTPLNTATATHTATGGAACAGDCDRNGAVGLNELIVGVNIALNNAAVGTCPAFDLDRNGQLTINELIGAVNSSLNGC
jgi:hypothetical protein